MVLITIKVSANEESITLPREFHAQVLRLKKVDVCFKTNNWDETAVCVQLDWLSSSQFVNNLNSNVIVVPTSRQNQPDTSWLYTSNFDYVFNDITVPKQFNVRLFKADGKTLYDMTKLQDVYLEFWGEE